MARTWLTGVLRIGINVNSITIAGTGTRPVTRDTRYKRKVDGLRDWVYFTVACWPLCKRGASRFDIGMSTSILLSNQISDREPRFNDEF